MMNLNETIEFLGKLFNSNYIIFRNNKTYDMEELLSFQKDLEGGSKTLEGFRVFVKEILSRRRALIVILQEKYYKLKSYYEAEINFSQIENNAKVRFLFENRDVRKFNHPQITHPKNPCLFYEDKKDEKAQYKKSLKILLDLKKIYFINDEALKDLLETYRNVIDC